MLAAVCHMAARCQGAPAGCWQLPMQRSQIWHGLPSCPAAVWGDQMGDMLWQVCCCNVPFLLIMHSLREVSNIS